MPQDKSPNPWTKTPLRVEMQHDGGVRNCSHWFAANLVYPADLFVLLQRFADNLGLDWDRGLYGMYADERGGHGSSLPPLLGGCLSPEGRVGINQLDKRQSKWMLRRIAERDWRDVVLIKGARGTHKVESEGDLWVTMDGMSNLSVSGSDVGEYSSAANEEEMELRVTTNGVSKRKLSDRRCRKRQKSKCE